MTNNLITQLNGHTFLTSWALGKKEKGKIIPKKAFSLFLSIE